MKTVPNYIVNTRNNQFENYAAEASFLWGIRAKAIEQPNYIREDIYMLEQRIEKQLNNLMTSVEESWCVCLEYLAQQSPEPGAVFTSTIIAFRSHDVLKIKKIIDVGLRYDSAFTGLVSAMGWLPDSFVNLWVKKFFTSKDLNHKFLSISVCSVRRENPTEYLSRIFERNDCKQHEKLYSRALRLVGELRRLDLLPELEQATNSINENIRFWAIWSSILVGNREEVMKLEPYILKPGPHQYNAINIAFRVFTIEQGRSMLSKLSEDTQNIRMLIKATGILGDPYAINWLISLMENISVSKLSAEAMCMITGTDLEVEQLVLQAPPIIVKHADDDGIPLAVAEDETLLWPDPKKVSQLWMNQGMYFVAGHRYFMGKPITHDLLTSIITNGNQRQRHAASMELALSNSPVPLQNTRARIEKVN